MIFSNFTRSETDNQILFQNTLPIKNVGVLKFYADNLSGIFTKKEFRWSFNNNYWASWETLNQGNFTNISADGNQYLFLEIRYIKSNTSSIVTNFSVSYLKSTSSSPVVNETIIASDPVTGCSIDYNDVCNAACLTNDADYLNGQPGSYYLWRANHKGLQPISTITNLQTTLTNLYELIVDASVTAYYNTALDESIITYFPVGGYSIDVSVGSLYRNTVTKMWDDLLFPIIDPTFISPSLNFTTDISSLQEIGDLVTISFTSIFDKGEIYINTSNQDFRSGNPLNYNYTDPSGNTLLTDVSSNLLINNPSINNYLVTTGVQSFTNNVNYSTGPQPIDSRLDNFSTPLVAGTTSNNIISIEGIYPLFATTSDISTYLNQSYVSMITGDNIEFNLVSESSIYKQSFSIPWDWINLRPLYSIETYNTLSNNWEYQGESSTNSLTYWTSDISTRIIQALDVSYYNYVYNGPNRSLINIRIKF